MVADGGTSRGPAGGAHGRLNRILTALLVTVFLVLSYELFFGALVWAVSGLFGLPVRLATALAVITAVSGLWIGTRLFRRTYTIDTAG